MVTDNFITSEIRRITKIAIRNKWSKSQLNQELTRVLSPYYTKQNLNDLIKNSIKKDYDFVTKSVTDTEYSNNLQSVFKDSAKYFAEQKGNTNDKIIDLVTNAINNDWDSEKIVNELESNLHTRLHHAQTIVKTAQGAISTLSTIIKANELGITKFEYAGSPPERPFCKHFFGKILTIDEINHLSKIYGYDVLLYRGRWNCRHFWQPIV